MEHYKDFDAITYVLKMMLKYAKEIPYNVHLGPRKSWEHPPRSLALRERCEWQPF